MAASLEPGGLLNLASAALMLGLSVALLLLDPSNRVSRAFAWFLLARGGLNVLDGFRFPPVDARLAAYYGVATLLLGLFFAYEYRRRYARRAAHAAVPWVLLGVGLALETALLLQPGLWLDAATLRAGPLLLADTLRLLSYAGIALVLLLDADRAPDPPSRSALVLASVGFASFPAFVAGRSLAGWTGHVAAGALPDRLAAAAAADPWRLAHDAILLLVVPLVVLTALLLARRGERAGAAFLGLVGVAAFGARLASGNDPALALAMDGLTTLALPVLVAYALLRHRLFGLDVKVKWTISRGAVAGVFLAVFFVVAQVAEIYLQQYGTLAGGVAAGLMLFAISPLQRMGERIAAAAMPHVEGGMTLTERELAYRDMAALAWADGTLTARGRDRLDAARERLGIPAERALALEREARQGPG